MSEKLNCANCCIADFKENLCDCDGDFCKEFKKIGRSKDFEIAVMERIRSNGRWEQKPDPFGFFDTIPVCSECGCTTKMRETYKYCPNCGARMEDEHD